MRPLALQVALRVERDIEAVPQALAGEAGIVALRQQHGFVELDRVPATGGEDACAKTTSGPSGRFIGKRCRMSSLTGKLPWIFT